MGTNPTTNHMVHYMESDGGDTTVSPPSVDTNCSILVVSNRTKTPISFGEGWKGFHSTSPSTPFSLLYVIPLCFSDTHLPSLDFYDHLYPSPEEGLGQEG